jgi:hypothetical protein
MVWFSGKRRLVRNVHAPGASDAPAPKGVMLFERIDAGFTEMKKADLSTRFS